MKLLVRNAIKFNHTTGHNMKSIENQIKEEYSKIFRKSDWELFKTGANYYLRTAALLKMADINLTEDEKLAVYCKDNRLLFRNIQKRLFVGIACELLIKAYFLKSGYIINKPSDNEKHKGVLYIENTIPDSELNEKDTFTFSKLFDVLLKLEKAKTHNSKSKVSTEIIEGLRIAKVFRNKEAHVITSTHQYNEMDYTKIERCIVRAFQDWFNEQLDFSISFEKNEVGKFEIK